MDQLATWLSRGDGSGRNLRNVQVDAFKFLDANWTKARFKAMQLAVGSGKSLIAKAVQDTTKGAVITPSNILIRQYLETYPHSNELMGRAHYQCTGFGGGLDCMSVKDNNLYVDQDTGECGGYCKKCPYVEKREAARRGVPTFFNPMSYNNLQNKNYTTMIVDEAHQLISMLMMTTGRKFWNSQTKLPDNARNEFEVIAWFDKILPGLRRNQRLYSFATLKSAAGKDKDSAARKLQEIDETIEAIEGLRKGLSEEPHNYAIWYEEGKNRGSKDSCLNIKPIRVPRFALNYLYSGVDSVVLMSGTLLEHDLQDLTIGQSTAFADFPSPIPKERRLIHHEPTAYNINFQTDPRQLAKDIMKKCAANPGNTMIHVTYEWSKKLAPFMPPQVLTNTADTKDKVLAKFKKEGGIFMAAGCAEGIDLPGDLCRTNIIPVLAYPNINDEVVKKRKSLEGGELWYVLETLKVFIQQAGRSTRNETDYSKTIVMPPAFKWLVKKNHSKLPTSFTEALVWGDGK